MAKKDEAVVEVKADTSQLDQAFEKAENAVKDLGKAGEESIGLLDSMTGGFASKLVQARAGIGSMIKGLNLTKVALISTGIGAFVVAIGSLVAYFTQTAEGAKMVEAALNGFQAVFRVIIDRIAQMGGAIVKLFKGDFKGAFDDASKALSGMGDEIAKEYNAMTQLTQAAQALRKSQRDITVETAKQRAEIERLKMVSDDQTKSVKERIKAARDAAALEKKLVEERVRIAEEEFRIEKARQATTFASEEDLMKLAQLEAEVYNIRQESTTLQTELQNKVNGLRQEGIRLAEEEKKAIQEAITAYREANKMTEVQSLPNVAKLENQALKEILDERTLIVGTAIQTQEQLEADAAARRKQMFEDNTEFYAGEVTKFIKDTGQMVTMGLQVADALGTLFQKNEEKRARQTFQIQKALSITSAIMSTAEGVTAALTDKTQPSTVARIIQAVAVGVMGAAQVASIARQQFKPSGGASAPSAPAMAAAPAPGFFPPANNETSGFRAYVVGSEVSNQMQASQRLKERVALFN
jgi:hypothetical protein